MACTIYFSSGLNNLLFFPFRVVDDICFAALIVVVSVPHGGGVMDDGQEH